MSVPIKKFKIYPIEVAIWRFEDKDTGYPRFSIKVGKEVKDKDTQKYVSKEYLYPEELSLVSVLSAQALGWISDQESAGRSPEGSSDKKDIAAEDAF